MTLSLRKLLKSRTVKIGFVIGLGIGLYFGLTSANPSAQKQLNSLIPDLQNGEIIFTASGCASCHVSEAALKGDDKNSNAKLTLSGGQAFASSFGTFYAPNISMDKEFGIGSWSLQEFEAAIRQGISRQKEHLFPAFPYTSYIKMKDQDVVDLYAYMQTLPVINTPSKNHDVSFPFNIRRNLWGWKLLFLSPNYTQPAQTQSLQRGRYLVEALGHCAECHTPRNLLGGLRKSEWMEGAKSADGKSNIPAITSKKLNWSKDEIVEYLTSGFTPDYDMAGGHMAHVVENISQLSLADREAIAEYLLNN